MSYMVDISLVVVIIWNRTCRDPFFQQTGFKNKWKQQ